MAENSSSFLDRIFDRNSKPVKKQSSQPKANFSELGYTGLNRYGGYVQEEFLSNLQGENGIDVYREMSNNDPVISAFLFAIKQLVRQVDWKVEQPKDTPEHREAAEFLRQCMFKDLDQEFDDLLGEILTFLTYGFSIMEIVYKKRDGTESKYDDGRIGWEAFRPRGQETIEKWDFDENGKVEGLYQVGPPEYRKVYLPKEKYLHFITNSQQANPRGKSILRASYRSWKIKKNLEEIEAIGLEKNLVGIPLLQPPEGLDIWDQSDPNMNSLRADAEELVKNIRRDEQAGIVLPAGWDLELLGSGGQRPTDVTDTILKRYSQRLATSTLADFLVLGQNQQGSYAQEISKQQLFSQALDGWTGGIADTINNQAVNPLFELNDFDIQEYPQVKPSSVQRTSLEGLGQFVKNISGAGAPLFPDKELENTLRKRANLPLKEDGE